MARIDSSPVFASGSFWRSIGIIALFILLLTGCSSPAVKTICPTYMVYSKEDDHALLAELRAHPELTNTRKYLRDSGKLRKSAAVICGDK